MASSDPVPIVSSTGIIHVLSYTPTEGEPGVPITARIHFHPDLADAMYVRLVVGNKAVPTKVRQLPNVNYGRWQLYAAAPPFDRTQNSSTKVLLSVQALNDDNAILDTVTFGEFSYWAQGTSERRPSMSIDRLPRLHIPDTTTTTSLRRRPTNHLSTPSPTTSDRSPFSKSPQQRKTRLHRRIKAQSLIRTKHPAEVPSQEDLYAQTPILDMVTPLSNICLGWSQTELAVGRRLVRFAKVQDGRRLIVSCEPISPDQFCESDSVISCIYREESETCYVTSVDVIYLLERLTNGEFPVEEKNRIRRNLEGLRPTTVSKHKAGFGDFFQRIMEFPDPKPRNIEKDLKVFEWNLLGQALEKILSKYSIYTSNASEPDSELTVSSPTTIGSPELYALQLSYPPPEEATTSRFLDQKVAAAPQKGSSNIQKIDPYGSIDTGSADDFVFMPGISASTTTADLASASDTALGTFASPVDSVATSSSSSSSSSAFPLFTRDPPDGVPDIAAHSDDGGLGAVGIGMGVGEHPWGAPFKSANDLSMENFNILASYDVVEPCATNPGVAGGGIHAPYGIVGGAGVGMGHGGGGGIDGMGGPGNGGLDFGLYDNFAFQGIADDTLASLADQYI